MDLSSQIMDLDLFDIGFFNCFMRVLAWECFRNDFRTGYGIHPTNEDD